MKYVILIPQLKRGGPNNVIKNLIESKFYSDFELFLISIRDCDDSDYKEEFSLNSKVKFINLSGKSTIVKILNFKKILNEIHPDFVHSHGFYPDIFLSIVNGNFKKITTIHNVIYQDYFFRYGFKGYLFSLIHYTFLKYGKMYKIFGCSSEVARSLSKIIKKDNVDFVNNGVKVNDFFPLTSDEKKIMKKKLDINEEIVISFCGGIERVKRVPELVDNYIKYLKGFSYKFIIIGDGPELVKITESENISKIGRVSSPADYLKISDIVVSNSSSEGYPMAILEALASGCKVFLSNIPSHTYIIKKYPKCAFGIDNLNKDFIYKILDNKLDDDDIYSISSERMANEYLNKCDFYE